MDLRDNPNRLQQFHQYQVVRSRRRATFRNSTSSRCARSAPIRKHDSLQRRLGSPRSAPGVSVGRSGSMAGDQPLRIFSNAAASTANPSAVSYLRSRAHRHVLASVDDVYDPNGPRHPRRDLQTPVEWSTYNFETAVWSFIKSFRSIRASVGTLLGGRRSGEGRGARSSTRRPRAPRAPGIRLRREMQPLFDPRRAWRHQRHRAPARIGQ